MALEDAAAWDEVAEELRNVYARAAAKNAYAVDRGPGPAEAVFLAAARVCGLTASAVPDAVFELLPALVAEQLRRAPPALEALGCK